MTYIFQIVENTPEHEVVYIRTTDFAIDRRKYLGGFTRFLSCIYDYTHPRDERTEIDGKKIMNVKEFDEWRKEHGCC